MNTKAKLLDKARTGRLTFREFLVLLSQQGWTKVRQKGSHQIWQSPGGRMVPVEKGPSGDAKAYQIGQFLNILDKEESK